MSLREGVESQSHTVPDGRVRLQWVPSSQAELRLVDILMKSLATSAAAAAVAERGGV